MEFEGEIKEFKAVKSVSNDKQMKLVILTGDPKSLELIHFEADKLYKIKIDG